jgi:hypothetical protein
MAETGRAALPAANRAQTVRPLKPASKAARPPATATPLGVTAAADAEATAATTEAEAATATDQAESTHGPPMPVLLLR